MKLLEKMARDYFESMTDDEDQLRYAEACYICGFIAARELAVSLAKLHLVSNAPGTQTIGDFIIETTPIWEHFEKLGEEEVPE